MDKERKPYLLVTRNLVKKLGDNKPDLRGFITLPQSLPAGEYEIPLYAGFSRKGNKKYSGFIKPKEKIVAHWQDNNDN